MKKAFFLLLVLALCLPLCACGDGNAANTKAKLDILGEWVSVMDNAYTLTFQDDGTCFYTGTPPTNPSQNTVTIIWEDSSSNTESTQCYKYAFNREVGIITIYSSISTNFEVVSEGGKTVLSTVNGMPSFVRAENYEGYHAVYMAQEEAKRQEDIANFFAEGKEGCTELEFDTAYAITDELTLTAIEFVRGGTLDEDGKHPLFLHVTLTNVTKESVTIRPGYDEQNGFRYMTGRGIQFGVNTYGYGMSAFGKEFGGKYVLTKINDDYPGSGSIPKLTLEANASSDYYISISRAKTNFDDSDISTYYEPFYAILTFDNIELFCNATELEKNAVIATTSSDESTTDPTQEPTTDSTQEPTTDSTQEPTTDSTQEPTTDSTQKPTTAPTEKPTNSVQCTHSYQEATCERPMTCSRCGMQEGSVSGHIDNNGTCSICGETRQGTEYTEKVLNYLKANAGKNVTADDVAAALGMVNRSVDAIFTSAIQSKGLGVRIHAEIQLEDGTYKAVRYLSLTPAGMAYELWR